MLWTASASAFVRTTLQDERDQGLDEFLSKFSPGFVAPRWTVSRMWDRLKELGDRCLEISCEGLTRSDRSEKAPMLVDYNDLQWRTRCCDPRLERAHGSCRKDKRVPAGDQFGRP